jgi:hypothetical protein
MEEAKKKGKVYGRRWPTILSPDRRREKPRRDGGRPSGVWAEPDLVGQYTARYTQRGNEKAGSGGPSLTHRVGGPVLTPGSHTLHACQVLSPEELAARLDYYAERAAARLPLFEDGDPVPPEAIVFECWGCGLGTPYRLKGDRLYRMMPASCPGWVTEQSTFRGQKKVVWCPDCAAMPGFGCVEEDDEQDEAA